MNHFVVYPSADQKRGIECAEKWRALGYQGLVVFDLGTNWRLENGFMGMTCRETPFPGYYKTMNDAIGQAFIWGADLVTAVGDDMDPPKEGAARVAEIYFNRFPRGEGVMQACGDPQGKDNHGVPAAARICGSPTFGRRWWKLGYDGEGPFWSEYASYYGDEDLKNHAEKKGLLWMNPAIEIRHRHWTFENRKPEPYQYEKMNRHWERDQKIFMRRKSEGFPP